MKKFKAIVKVGEKYEELELFSESTKDIRKLDGFIKILESNKIKHPSPEVMCKAILSFDVDLVKFYRRCEEIRLDIEQSNKDAKTNSTDK